MTGFNNLLALTETNGNVQLACFANLPINPLYSPGHKYMSIINNNKNKQYDTH